ncbi:MAG: ricin-type beta-trefoil lectin domain protein [Saprospiraceae bacterium]
MEKDSKSKQTKIYLLLLMTTLFGPALLNAQYDYWSYMENHYSVAAVEEAKRGERSLQMWNNDHNYKVTYTGSYVDLTVPTNVNYDHLRLEVRGADGGNRINTALITPFKTKGGGGALIKGYLKIGTGENEVPPGSTVRMIIGLRGTTDDSFLTEGVDGGGGTGLFIKKPNESSWETIAVAGGGGGAYQDCCSIQSEGQSASSKTWGSNGYKDGGRNGSDADNGGGGGVNNALKNGVPIGSQDEWTSSGDYYASTVHSGFGCGFGGHYNDSAGGGGGGYSGGGRGSVLMSSGGGGSYYNSLWLFFSDITILPKTHNPMDGYVVFQLTDNAPEVTTLHFTYNSNKCIDDYRSNIDNGTNIQTYTCTGNSNQQWYLNTADRTIHSMLDYDKCIDLDNMKTANGTNIRLWGCNGNDAQKWVYNGLYKTMHSGVNSNKCFDATNGSAYPNSNVNLQLWDCNYTSNNMKWTIEGATTVSDPAAVRHIVPVLAPGFAVHSHTGEQYGSNIQLWTKDDINMAEQWDFAGLIIKMRSNHNLCIDLRDSNTDNGNNIQLWGCNGADAQKWLYDGLTKSIRSVVNPGKCMQIEKNTDGVYGKRSNVNIYDCNGSDAQQFLIQK